MESLLPVSRSCPGCSYRRRRLRRESGRSAATSSSRTPGSG